MPARHSKDIQEKAAKVLVADDSKLVRVTATKFLSAQFDLVFAEDGEEAWQKLCADESIQVVFTDLGMPKLDGYGLIERIRKSENERIRNQPIIVITGASEDEEVKAKVLELGATDFITKPFKSTEILARAEAHANYRRDRASLQENLDVDLLTGALNRNGLLKQLDKDVSFVNRHSGNLAVISFELDNFEDLHEHLSEQTSDRIIKYAADMLLGCVRKEDSVGRYSLGKFIVTLPMARTDGVISLAQRICAQVKSSKMTLGGKTLPITMSAGISTVTNGGQTTAHELLQSAEKTLVNAKKLGPSTVQLFELETQPTDSHAALSIDNLLSAITENRVEITEKQMDEALKRLTPLLAMMSDQQKQRLLNS